MIMLCQNCNEKTASVHLTKIINGEKTELYLCEQCAREKGELNFTTEPFSIQNLLAGIIMPELHPGRNIMKQEIDQCKNCQMSFAEFGKLGRFGCSECYDEFGSRLSQMMRRIHGSDQHTGKIPERQGTVFLKKRKIQELRKELQQAIVKEEFEKAAELRDQIYELEKRDGGEQQ